MRYRRRKRKGGGRAHHGKDSCYSWIYIYIYILVVKWPRFIQLPCTRVTRQCWSFLSSSSSFSRFHLRQFASRETEEVEAPCRQKLKFHPACTSQHSHSPSRNTFRRTAAPGQALLEMAQTLLHLLQLCQLTARVVIDGALLEQLYRLFEQIQRESRSPRGF